MADDIDNVKEIIVKELKELLDKNDALKRFFVAYSLEQNRALIALWLRKDAQFVNGLFNTIEGCYDPNRSKKDREALQKEVNDILKIKDVYEKAGSLINLILTATGA
ncbi:hypothetical protein AGMMS50276_14800 [Synergistales bacterium]|nr:hypothetical protein AGMMS50276_14800 [Synergistales bacterium]